MGRKPRAADEVPEEPLGEVPDEAKGESQGPGLSIFDASGDARVRLLRRDDRTQKWVPHGYFPADSTEETILRVYGGGRYWAQLLVAAENGKESIKHQRQFDLAGLYIPPKDGIPGIHREVDAEGKPSYTKRIDSSAAVTAPSSMPTGGELMQALNAGVISSVIDLLGKMREANKSPASDPMLAEILRRQSETQEKMFEIVLTLVGKDAKPEKTVDPRKEILDMMVQLKEIMAPNVGATSPTDPAKIMESIVSTVKQLREVSEEILPEKNSGTGDPMFDSIPGILEIIKEEQRLRREGSTSKPTQGQQPVPRQIPQQTDSDVPLWRRVLHSEGPRLLTFAKSNTDAEFVAKMGVTFASQEIKDSLSEFFHKPEEEIVGFILTEIPDLKNYPEWLASFIESSQFLLFPEEFDDDDGVSSGENNDGTEQGR